MPLRTVFIRVQPESRHLEVPGEAGVWQEQILEPVEELREKSSTTVRLCSARS